MSESTIPKVKITIDGHPLWDVPKPAADELEAANKNAAEIQRRLNFAINALFDVCKADWGIGHSIAKPAHKAIKDLAKLQEKDDG
jgi:hypothetical protein